MTIPRETDDLLTACAAAPLAPQRYAATVLLARKLVARFDGSGREHRRASGQQDHAALVDLEGATTGPRTVSIGACPYNTGALSRPLRGPELVRPRLQV
jgi:hypothetical protein